MKELPSLLTCTRVNDLTINTDYRFVLERAGLDCFNSVWRYNRGETIKQIPLRSLIRFDLDVHGEKKYFYLKKHNLESVGFKKLLSYFKRKTTLSQGYIEFNHICDFRKHGLATVIPVAAGEKSSGFFKSTSFLLTLDVFPYISLEYFMEKKPDFFSGSKGVNRKKILIRELALLSKKMHACGFNHRDFNATHILLFYNDTSDIPKLALFDLQRVDKKKYLRFFWAIKSMAELGYTLPSYLFDENDRYSLFLSYKGKTRLNMMDRLQWHLIKRKINRISRHVKKVKKKRRHAFL